MSKQQRAARRLMERLVTVADIASDELVIVPPGFSIAEARELLDQHQIDQAPLGEDPIRRSIHVDELQGEGTEPAARHARPIVAADVVSDTAGLAAVIPRLREQEFLYVIGSDDVSGIVTRADLQLPPVSMAVLGVVLSLEQALSLLIDWYSHGSWLDLLDDERRSRLDQRFEQRTNANAELSRLECLDLADRLALVKALPELRGDLGITSGNALEKFQNQIQKLRDPLAHGGDVISAHADLDKTLDAIDSTIEMADRAWTLVHDSDFLWDAYLTTIIELKEHPRVASMRLRRSGDEPFPTDFSMHVLSAENPDGKRLTEAENKNRTAQLRASIDSCSRQWWWATGLSEGSWRERSIAAVGSPVRRRTRSQRSSDNGRSSRSLPRSSA